MKGVLVCTHTHTHRYIYTHARARTGSLAQRVLWSKTLADPTDAELSRTNMFVDNLLWEVSIKPHF